MRIISAPKSLKNTSLNIDWNDIFKLANYKKKYDRTDILKKIDQMIIKTNFIGSASILKEEVKNEIENNILLDKDISVDIKLLNKLSTKLVRKKIVYTNPKKNNLLEYLSILIIFKIVILDISEHLSEQKKELKEIKEMIKEYEEAIELGENKLSEEYDRNIKTINEIDEINSTRDKNNRILLNGFCSFCNLLSGNTWFKKIRNVNKILTFKIGQLESVKEESDKEIERLNKSLKEDREDLSDLYCAEKIFLSICNFENKYLEIDYKVSIHMRFVRSMIALNRYTEENIFDYEYLKSNYKPGQSDLFFRIIKKKNLMKLRRNKVNRYVTVHHGGIYTTVTSHPEERKHERTKFGVAQKEAGRWVLKDAKHGGQKGTPIWDHSSTENENDTLEKRINKSCKTFNYSIENSVISTYANYYGVNNKLVVNEKKLYLEYTEKSNKLTIPLYVESQDVIKKKAPLHVLIDENNMPSTIDNFNYLKCKDEERTDATDIKGLLYTIRKGKIAVQLNIKKAGFHSTMWSGKAVQAAGTLCTWNGKIIAVDNSSGHYRPNWNLLYKAWEDFYKQGVFHDHGMVGILAKAKTKPASQFFKAKIFFEELANNNFPIGRTVEELKNHLKELTHIGTFNVIQQNGFDCSNVFKSPHMKEYHSIWNNKDERDSLACEFIISMEYDWKEFIDNVDKSLANRKNINHKKILYNTKARFQKAFNEYNKKAPIFSQEYKSHSEKQTNELNQNYQVLEKCIQNVTKAAVEENKNKPDIRLLNLIELVGKVESPKKGNELKNFIENVKESKSIAGKIAMNLVMQGRPYKPFNDYEKKAGDLIDKYNDNLKALNDTTKKYLFTLIPAMNELVSAYEEYNNKEDTKLNKMVEYVNNALSVKANPKAGLGGGDIFLKEAEQEKAAMQYFEEKKSKSIDVFLDSTYIREEVKKILSKVEIREEVKKILEKVVNTAKNQKKKL